MGWRQLEKNHELVTFMDLDRTQSAGRLRRAPSSRSARGSWRQHSKKLMRGACCWKSRSCASWQVPLLHLAFIQQHL